MTTLRAVPDSPPRAVLYLRQSTHREESISLELQETAGRDYCARMGYTVIAVEADPGISGRTWVRPAVTRVMAMIENGDADIIVLWRWSRLSRSRKDWAVAADRVDVAGGRIESATEPNDVTAAGRFARGVMTELAAFESERIGEQWKEVQDRRRRNGLPGGGKVPYGWMYRDGQIVAHPDQGSAIPAMFQHYLAGAGSRAIADWLEANGYRTYSGSLKWSHTTVTQTLDSPFHAGFVVHQGQTMPGAHQPLVDETTWRRYLAVRRARSEQRAVKNRYLLSGIVRCATCSGPMYGFTISGRNGHRSSADYFGYRCKAVGSDRAHGPGTMSARTVDTLVLAWLRELADDVDLRVEVSETDAKLDAQRIARETISLDKQIVALTEGLASGLVPEHAYRSTMTLLDERRKKLTRALQAAEDRIVLAPDDPAGVARSLVADWDALPLTAKRAGLKELLVQITVECRGQRSVRIVPRWGEPVAVDV